MTFWENAGKDKRKELSTTRQTLHLRFLHTTIGREAIMYINRALTAFLIVFLIGMMPVSTAAGDRFSDNGDGTVTDNETGLMWANSDNQGDIDWKQALRWVKYTFPDTVGTRYDDWRMPTLAELQTLVNADKSFRGYETDCGQWVRLVTDRIRLSCGWVWTADTDAIAPAAKVFNFDNVYHYSARMAHKRGYRVLPVRTVK